MRHETIGQNIAIAVASLLAAASPVSAQDLDAPLDAATKQRVIDDTDRAIRKHFAHWQGVPALDYERHVAAYRKAALDAGDRRSFSLLTRAFVAGLNNGHTQFNDDALFRSDPGNLGIGLRYLDGTWAVARSRRADILAGSTILAIDEQPFEDFYQNRKALISASNERTRRTILSSYPFLFPRRFTLTLGDGSRVGIDRTAPLVQAPNPAPAPDPTLVTHRWIAPGNIGYLAIRSFGDPAYEAEARRLVRSVFGEAPALIIDLRGNGGGGTPSGLARDLLGSGWLRWKTSPPTAVVPSHKRPLPPSPHYVLLVDNGCASACEDFAISFSISSRAVLVGETTAGSSGQPHFTDWGNGMKLWVGSRRQWFPDGREFEGVGVEPDIVIDLRPEDFRAGAPDIALACAARLLGGESAATCPN